MSVTALVNDMVSEFCIFTFLSCVIFRLIFLPSHNRDKASNICFGVFNEETWGIKWSWIESAMILFSLAIFFLYFALASSPFGSWTSSSMKIYRSLSSKMIITLYLHAHKLSSPSTFSSILVLEVIMPWDLEIWKKLRLCINEFWTYQLLRYAKVTSFIQGYAPPSAFKCPNILT